MKNRMFKKVLAIILTLCFAGMTAGGCGNNESGKTDETTAQAETKAAEIKTNLPKLDMKKWQYDEDDKIYYQLGLDYCEKPADKTYELCPPRKNRQKIHAKNRMKRMTNMI